MGAKMQLLEVVTGHSQFHSHFSILVPQAMPTQPVMVSHGVLGELEALAALRRELASDRSPEAQRRSVELMEVEARATREAVSRAMTTASRPYGSKPAGPAQTAVSPSSGSSGSTSPRRSYRESPRRTPSPRSPDAHASPAQSDSSFQRRVQFGADHTLSFHQSAAERLAQRCDEIVAVIMGSFDDGHGSLEQMQRVLRDMDPDGNGLIDAGDLGWAIEDMQLGLTVQEIDDLVEALDARNEQVCEYNVLLAALGASPTTARVDVRSSASKPESAASFAGTSPRAQLATADGGWENQFDADQRPEESGERQTETQRDTERHRETPEPEPEHRGSDAVGRAAARIAADGTLESVFAAAEIDPYDPAAVKALAAFNDRLEAEVFHGTHRQESAAEDGFKPKLRGRAAEVAARTKTKGDVADLWECTFEPDTHPQVLNRHGMTGVRPPAATARTRLLQEYVARELQISDTDYMSDRLLDEAVSEAAANGWLTQSNVNLVARKYGTEKLSTIANILKARNSMALVDAQLKQVQEERDKQRAADAAAKERTNAQAQKAWVSDLRATTPNRARQPWKPTRGVGTADGTNSPRKVGNMVHEESVIMKKQHDLMYGSYSATGVPASSPRVARPDAKKAMTFHERMQADISNRQRKMKDLGEGPTASARKEPPAVAARQSPVVASPRGGKQRRPSKMSPPRPARVSRIHASPERASSDLSWLGNTGMSREDEDALLEEQALAAIEARLQRLAGEFNSRHPERKQGGSGASPAKRRSRISSSPARDALGTQAPQLVPLQRKPKPNLVRATDTATNRHRHREKPPEPEPESELELEPSWSAGAGARPASGARSGTLDRYPTVPSTRPADSEEAAGHSVAVVPFAARQDDLAHQDATLGSASKADASSDSSGRNSPLLLPETTIANAAGSRGGGHSESWMRRLGLSSIAAQLESLGVEEEEDLKHLQESDIAALNLKVVTARKLRDAVSRYQ